MPVWSIASGVPWHAAPSHSGPPVRFAAPPRLADPGAGPGARNSASSGCTRSSASSGKRSVAEVQMVDLDWRGLGCSYKTSAGTKWVLDDVFGAAQPGEMQVGRLAGGQRRQRR
jgi:hypothetical protein